MHFFQLKYIATRKSQQIHIKRTSHKIIPTCLDAKAPSLGNLEHKGVEAPIQQTSY